MNGYYDKEKILVIAAELSDKDSYMFKLRMGLIDNEAHSLREISELLNMPIDGVSRELRRIEQYVLSKIAPEERVQPQPVPEKDNEGATIIVRNKSNDPVDILKALELMDSALVKQIFMQSGPPPSDLQKLFTVYENAHAEKFREEWELSNATITRMGGSVMIAIKMEGWK